MNLAHDSVVWLSHTTNNDYFDPGDSMIVPKYLYATDITGDGIPDLLVSDGVHIWIFKGWTRSGIIRSRRAVRIMRFPIHALSILKTSRTRKTSAFR